MKHQGITGIVGKDTTWSPYLLALVNTGIPEHQHTYWCQYVQAYLDFCTNGGFGHENGSKLDEYLNSLKRRCNETWQCIQAEKAIVLYLRTVRGKSRNASVKMRPAHLINGYIVEKDELSFSDSAITGQQVSEKVVPGDPWDELECRFATTLKELHYSPVTQKHYTGWFRQFRKYLNGKRLPVIHTSDVKSFLKYLRVHRNVSVSTQNQAFNALQILLRNVLNLPFDQIVVSGRKKAAKKLPVVMSPNEIEKVLSGLREPYRLLAEIIYGCGLCLEEGLNLRIDDVNFTQRLVMINLGKGIRDRSIPLPESLVIRLQNHIELIRCKYDSDRKDTMCQGVYIPESIDTTTQRLGKEWGVFWLFPARELTKLPDTLTYCRNHVHPTAFQREFRSAVKVVRIAGRVTVQTLRHSYAVHLLQAGYDIRQVQKLLGHADIRTTMVYTQLLQSESKALRSPLDIIRQSAKR